MHNVTANIAGGEVNIAGSFCRLVLIPGRWVEVGVVVARVCGVDEAGDAGTVSAYIWLSETDLEIKMEKIVDWIEVVGIPALFVLLPVAIAADMYL